MAKRLKTEVIPQIRISPLFHEKIRTAAALQQETVAEYVRKSVERRLWDEGSR